VDILEYGRDLDVAVKREMNSDLRRLMRILLHTEREEVEVDIAQAHKEAQVGQTAFICFAHIQVERSKVLFSGMWGVKK